MKKTMLMLFTLMMIVGGCQNRGGNQEAAAEEDKIPAIRPFLKDVDDKTRTHVETIVDHYLHIQHALVNSDSVEAKAGAAMIIGEMKKFDTLTLQGNDRTEYTRFGPNIRVTAESIGKISDLAGQRSGFRELSNNVYGLVKAFGYKKTLYKVHCPMAFNNAGADWLSTENEVRNPYYGKDMLECGTVEEAIQK